MLPSLKMLNSPPSVVLSGYFYADCNPVVMFSEFMSKVFLIRVLAVRTPPLLGYLFYMVSSSPWIAVYNCLAAYSAALRTLFPADEGGFNLSLDLSWDFGTRWTKPIFFSWPNTSYDFLRLLRLDWDLRERTDDLSELSWPWSDMRTVIPLIGLGVPYLTCVNWLMRFSCLLLHFFRSRAKGTFGLTRIRLFTIWIFLRFISS